MVKKRISWKDKKLYTILAPEIFNLQELGVTFANDSKKLIGREVEIPLSTLLDDDSKQNTIATFKIIQVDGDKAKTRFKTASLDSRYIRSKVKKDMEKVESIEDLNLSNSKLRIKVIVITHQSLPTSKSKIISSQVRNILNKEQGSSLDKFLQEALFGKLGTKIYRQVKKIAPVKRVEIEKIKVL